MTGPKAKRPARSRLAILAVFALGIPLIVIANVWSRALWPILPILIGGWVVVMLVIRTVITYRIISLAGLPKTTGNRPTRNRSARGSNRRSPTDAPRQKLNTPIV